LSYPYRLFCSIRQARKQCIRQAGVPEGISMEENGSVSLSANSGIAADYINVLGQRQTISPHTIERLLNAMGCTAGPGTTPAAPLPPVLVYRQTAPYRDDPDDRYRLTA